MAGGGWGGERAQWELWGGGLGREGGMVISGNIYIYIKDEKNKKERKPSLNWSFLPLLFSPPPGVQRRWRWWGLGGRDLDIDARDICLS